MNINLLDCTLRDGGYYNDWDFATELVISYLDAMVAIKADFVEIGFRSTKNQGFKGGFAFSTDTFINSLNIPSELENKIGVMINASELVAPEPGLVKVLEKLFVAKAKSPVTLVRIACHVHEFEKALPAVHWLKEQGYLVGVNLMQVADKTDEELELLATLASHYPLDVLYFADSMGSLKPEQVRHIVQTIQSIYKGPLGIHTHDNMNQAIANSVEAVATGVAWVDGTVTGMGRGPGNGQTEYAVIALSSYRNVTANITKLLECIRRHFKPMQEKHGWGTNPYYYLAGQHGIHPSYIQEMMADSRYDEEDILVVIEHLRVEGGKKFSLGTLEVARHFYQGQSRGSWSPKEIFQDKEVLLLGSGSGASKHRVALEAYIKQHKPIVLALNTKTAIEQSLIDYRIACHPIRLLADCEEHVALPQPLITPASMLPKDVLASLSGKKLLDYGLQVQADAYEISDTNCVIATSLVIAYALAVLASGKSKKILLAGFDGYGADDPRRKEVDAVFSNFSNSKDSCPMVSVTQTRYEILTESIYSTGSK